GLRPRTGPEGRVAAAAVLCPPATTPLALPTARPPRLSGYMIKTALVAGFPSVGMDVFQPAPMPPPAVAMLTRSMRADLGVMISASHNPYDDNGIKLFGPDGFK